MAQVTITQLPQAQALTGSESVPIVQNGQTVQTTTGAIAQQPTQTQTFLTVTQQVSLPNSRYLAVGSGLSTTDAGAQGTLQISLTGAAASLNASGTGIQVKTDANTLVPREIAVATGLLVSNGTGVSGNPTISLGTFLSNFQTLSGSTGLVGVNAGAISPLAIAGTSDQISVSNGDGAAGNPTVGLASNPVMPGSAGTVVPIGGTSDRPVGATNGTLRYNSDTAVFEGYANDSWGSITTGSGVTSVGTGTGLTGGPITSTGTISIDDTIVATLTGSQTLTNKTISGSSNTLSNIGNSSLTNSTISGVALGSNLYSLSAGTGLSGSSYNGSSAVTISIANTGVSAATYGSASAVPVFAVNAQGQITSVTNTNISIASSAITDKGLAGGVASLDGGGTVPTSQLPAAVLGGVSYQGTWNASTNTPTLTSSVGTKGYYYVVDVAGSTDLNGITDWKVGDWAIYNGSAWQKIDNTDAVTSVNGYTGTVVLSYSDVGAPSVSGTNATGTWAIGISGNAATATKSTNITGGTAGALPYNTAADTTTFLSLGTSGYVLTAGASAPAYVAQSTLSVGSATNATNATNTGITADSTNATNYLTFVSTTTGNLPQLVNSSITCNPSTGSLTGGITGGAF